MSSVSIILLAAGGSSRMHQPKQLLPFKGVPLLQHLAHVAAASDAEEVLVVLGSGAKQLHPFLAGDPVRVVLNKKWSQGLSSSIRSGMSEASSASDAVLLMLCDQPLVTTEILNAIMTRYRTTNAPVVASEYAGTLGVPALFDRSLFPKLMLLRGDAGAKPIILSHRSRAHTIPFPDGAVDLDTPEDLKFLEGA